MIVEKQKELGWGKGVVETLAKDLQSEFPGVRGYSATNLWSMVLLYTEYQGDTFLQSMIEEIGWTHNLRILDHQIDNKTFEKYLLNQTNFDQVPNENDAIRIIICKNKKRLIVEYSLKNSNVPIGIASYSTKPMLPDYYRSLLPDPEEMAKRIDRWLGNRD
jgi:hypothetical protein